MFLSRLTDEQIDRVASGVMNGQEFRSVRRRILEQMPASDADQGFLQNLINGFTDYLRTASLAISEFVRHILEVFSFNSLRSGADVQIPMDNSSGNTVDWWRLLIFVVTLLVLTLLTFVIGLVVRHRERQRLNRIEMNGDGIDDLTRLQVAPGHFRISLYERRAVQLAESGDLRGAVRELLLGAMSWIERNQYIRYRRGLTNRDYARAIRRLPHQYSAWMLTASEFERQFFGRRPATAQAFYQCLSAFQETFRESAETTVV